MEKKVASKVEEPDNVSSHLDEGGSVKEPELSMKSLEGVKSGFETEAENSILKAIELNERKREKEQSTSNSFDQAGRSSILTGVPASAKHLFEDDINLRNDNSPTNGNLMGVVLPALDIVKPSETATPSLEDITTRMDMIERLAIARQKTIKNLSVPETEVEDRSNNFIDPESLVDNAHRIEIAPEAAMIEIRAQDQEKDNAYMHKKHGIYRRYCAPCFLFTGLVYKSFRDSGKYILLINLYLITALVAVSAILFYAAGNPEGNLGATYSWWLLFVSRHIITLILSYCTQFILIDYIALQTRWAVRVVGRLPTLMAMQAKGWPLIIVIWSLWNFALNFGKNRFNKHWLHRQDWIEMFKEEKNPSGTVVTDGTYRNFLVMLIVVGLAVMVKRVLIALLLGRKNYVKYAGKMESLMRKVLLISEVAMLSQDIAIGTSSEGGTRKSSTAAPQSNKKPWLLQNSALNTQDEEEEEEEEDDDDEIEEDKDNDDPKERKRLDVSAYFESSDKTSFRDDQVSEPVKLQTGLKMKYKHVKESLKIRHRASDKKSDKKSDKNSERRMSFLNESTDRILLDNLLGEWEEPEMKKKFSWKDSSISKVLQFQETLTYLDGDYPLSVPFGRAETRKQCLKSSQKVYYRLMLDKPKDSILHFDTIVSLARNKEGKIQEEKVRALIRLFRPDRNGNMTLLDFAKSCDRIYKKIKMFRVITTNSVQIDEAFETILNILFSLGLSILALFVLGVEPIGILTGLTGVLLPLSFLFSAAASKYFEGILLVLVRQPYDIGDRIAISPPSDDTPPDGSTTWYVENITLFTTTVRNAATNEVATYANGSLASLRIINARRSSNAMVTVGVKFGVEIPYEKVKVFRTVVEDFVKARPREWLSMLAFRATAIEADLGFIKYVLILQHIESWQNVGLVKESLAQVASFCLEVSKKMDMRFVNPPTSVRLEAPKRAADELQKKNSYDLDSDVKMLTNMFEIE